MNKKIIVLSIVAVIGVYLYVNPSKPNPDFICAHPNYSLIKAGQNGEIIKSIMGQADNRVVKEDINEYRFGQGDMENKIKEGWIYNYEGWNGHIEIYFSEDGAVIGKNCGNG